MSNLFDVAHYRDVSFDEQLRHCNSIKSIQEKLLLSQLKRE
jgi:hypothetical protein